MTVFTVEIWQERHKMIIWLSFFKIWLVCCCEFKANFFIWVFIPIGFSIQKLLKLLYAHHYNPLLIKNLSWILAMHKATILWKNSLKTKKLPSKMGQKVYKPRLIMERARKHVYCEHWTYKVDIINHFLSHCKKDSGNLWWQVKSCFHLMICTFKVLINRSFTFLLF